MAAFFFTMQVKTGRIKQAYTYSIPYTTYLFNLKLHQALGLRLCVGLMQIGCRTCGNWLFSCRPNGNCQTLVQALSQLQAQWNALVKIIGMSHEGHYWVLQNGGNKIKLTPLLQTLRSISKLFGVHSNPAFELVMGDPRSWDRKTEDRTELFKARTAQGPLKVTFMHRVAFIQ